MAITFDGANRRIVLDSADVSIEEIWSRWVDWSTVNSQWPIAMRSLGGDELGGGLYVANYFFLLNNWRIRPMESDHTLTMTGNITVDGGGSPLVPTLGNYRVIAQYTVPVQAQGIATSGSTGPTATQIANVVWQNAPAGGTDGPSAEEIATEVWANKPADPVFPTPPTPQEIATQVWLNQIEGSLSAASLQRILLAVLAGKVTGAGTGTEVFKDLANTKPRVTVTVDDNGNRTGVTLDGT